MRVLLLAGVLLSSASVAANQCNIHNVALCDDAEKAKIRDFMSMSKEELSSVVRLENVEVQSIQNKLRSENNKIQSQMNALRTSHKRQEVHKARQEMNKDRGQWMADWQKKMGEVSKQQQELSKTRAEMEKSLKASRAISPGADGGLSQRMEQLQDKQRSLNQQKQQLHKDRSEHSRDFGKRVQDFDKGQATWHRDSQEEIQSLTLKEAHRKKKGENDIMKQQKIVELARAVQRMSEVPKKAMAAKLGLAGSAPSSAGKLEAPGSVPFGAGSGHSEL